MFVYYKYLLLNMHGMNIKQSDWHILKFKFQVLSLSEFQFHANVKYPNVYVYCSTVQMFTRLGSISDTNLKFYVTVTANSEHHK